MTTQDMFDNTPRYLLDIPCPHCEHGTAVVYERGPHYRADCQQCGSYIKFVPKKVVYDSLGLPWP